MTRVLTSGLAGVVDRGPRRNLRTSSLAPRIGSSGAATKCPGITRIPGVCGGDPCIERTRIPVWVLFRMHQLGVTDSALLEDYPGLTMQDIQNAWNYVATHQTEIDRMVRENENW